MIIMLFLYFYINVMFDFFSANKNDHVQCMYLPHKDKVLFSNNCSIGMRKDFNGMLLLDTALQTPVSKTSDHVKVELPLPEVSYIGKGS